MEKRNGLKKTTVDYRIFRVGSLALVNAMLFQEILSKTSPVRTLRQTVESLDIVSELNKEWKKIQTTIDFVPIFRIAREILLALPSSPDTDKALRVLAESAIRISYNRAALRHDLMGRIFHRLLADGKYYGAFYTKIPSATLLLKLAVEAGDWHVKWKKPESVGELRIADLSCGTGTLLKASLATIVDKHINETLAKGVKAHPDKVHKILVEDGIWGFDVLSSAVHLAAAAIAMHDPNIAVDRMHLLAVPLGGKSLNLGSINFAKRTTKRSLHIQETMIGASIGPEEATTKKTKATTMPKLHLCTMNPPFTRSVYGNFLFGGIDETERSELQDKLREVLDEAKLDANITSGLGSVFVAIGDSMMEEDGVLALVLPKAVLSGQTWEPTRRIFGKYHLRYVVCSHEPNNWNFSESTELSETLLVLKKGNQKESDATFFVNLSNQPKTSIESLTLSSIIHKSTPADLTSETGTCELKTNDKKFGEMVKLSRKQISEISWAIPVAFAQTELCRVAYHLSQGKVFLPTIGVVGSIDTIELSKVTTLGPDGRDIYDGFDLTESITEYPALWGYDAESILTIRQSPNQYLSPLTKAKQGRPLRDANLLWSRAGTLMLPKELWLETSRVIATVLDSNALSNVWWPTRWKSEDDETRVKMERRLALWFNSTLGLLSILMQRQETRGAWVKFPKIWYEQLQVLDLGKIPKKQIETLDKLWDDVNGRALLPLPQMDKDETRKTIDDTFSKILRVPSFEPLRKILAREPLISLKIS